MLGRMLECILLVCFTLNLVCILFLFLHTLRMLFHIDKQIQVEVIYLQLDLKHASFWPEVEHMIHMLIFSRNVGSSLYFAGLFCHRKNV